MSILLDENTTTCIQGITGKEGVRITKYMKGTTKILFGVRPGKGGESVEGVKVTNSIKEGIDLFGKPDFSIVSVPPAFVKNAVKEAFENSIENVLILAENVPLHDSLWIINNKKNTRVIGPSSVGIISPGKGVLGSISNDKQVYSKGRVGIISKSGGICSETARLLTKEGIGQSTVIGIGGDRVCGFSYFDAMELFEKDDQTSLVVVYGEAGVENELELLRKNWSKPVICYISGEFLEKLELKRAFGHTGAILKSELTKASFKKKELSKKFIVVDYHHEIVSKVKQLLDRE